MDIGAGAGRFDLELVFPVERKVAVDLHAAARAEGQRLVAAVLRLPHRRDMGVHQGIHARIADGDAADLERCRQIALHGGWRDEQRVGQVVETAARVVGRQQRAVVELSGEFRQRQQIADGVGVFRPRQAVRQRRRARVGAGGRAGLELARQIAGGTSDDRLRRPRRTRGRHRAGPQLAQHLLPGLGLIAGARHASRIEHEAGGAQPLAVTGGAVLGDGRLRVSAGVGQGLGSGRRRRGAGAGWILRESLRVGDAEGPPHSSEREAGEETPSRHDGAS
jgi:hypothetical protein